MVKPSLRDRKTAPAGAVLDLHSYSVTQLLGGRLVLGGLGQGVEGDEEAMEARVGELLKGHWSQADEPARR